MIEIDMTHRRELWHDGPNYTADAIIIAHNKILLIQRKDTGTWAVPGGFIEPDESGLEASRRETQEETGVALTLPTALVYRGKVDDRRNSANAWIETEAYLYELDEEAVIHHGDDAANAAWVDIETIDTLYGSHNMLIEQALRYRRDAHVKDIFAQPLDLLDHRIISRGHMAYDHLLLSDAYNHQVFAKIHDPSQFSDATREQHSRLYLQKEKALFDHLSHHQFPHIPAQSELIGDHTLIIEAFPEDQGWQWQASADNLDTYIADNLAAIQQLEALPIIDGHENVKRTLESLNKEGWRSLDEDRLQRIQQQLTEWERRLHARALPWCKELREQLPSLRNAALALETPDKLTLAHHDLRQSNIAWHPTHGTRLVDWSWAGPAREKSDRTTLLIDLWKSGHDITKYLADHFNPDHALELIGFWLAHSLWPTHDGTDTVRFQQVASAVSAYELLQKYRDLESSEKTS